MRVSVGVGSETSGLITTENNKTFIGEYYLSGRVQDGRVSFWTNLGIVPVYRETKPDVSLPTPTLTRIKVLSLIHI